MKKFLVLSIITALLFFAYSCGEANTNSGTPIPKDGSTETGAPPAYDPHRGEGKFKKVELGATLDATMASSGEKVYSVKCSGCHKITEEKLVGPGWKGVTTRNAPEWIMNFITNTDEMLTKDPKAQAQLEICLVRMPNQNLSDDDARHLLEFMRKNDGVK